jgi:hypothetical protein
MWISPKLATAVAGLLILAACSSDSLGPKPPSGDNADLTIRFITRLPPHGLGSQQRAPGPRLLAGGRPDRYLAGARAERSAQARSVEYEWRLDGQRVGQGSVLVGGKADGVAECRPPWSDEGELVPVEPTMFGQGTFHPASGP